MGYQAYDQSGMNGTPVRSCLGTSHILPRRNHDAMVQGYGSHATGGYAASGYDQGAPQGYATAAPQASLTRRRIQLVPSRRHVDGRWK
jgi:hypothetical protein